MFTRRPGQLVRAFVAMLLVLVVFPFAAMGTEGDISIPLTIHEALRRGVSGVDRKSEPVTVGIPFPQGMLHEKNSVPRLRVEGAQAFQFRTLAKWPDGTVRWALVDFQADCRAGKLSKDMRVTRGHGNSPGNLLAQDRGEDILVDTGRITVTVRKKGFNLFDKVLVEGREVIAPGVSEGIVCVDGNDRRYLASADPRARVVIEENGPVRCVVRAMGTHYAGNKRMLNYTTRMHFYKGKSRVKVFYTLRNASEKQFEHAYIRSLHLVTTPSIKGAYQAKIAGHDRTTERKLSPNNHELIYYQAVSDFPQEYAGRSFLDKPPIPLTKKKRGRRFSFLQEGYWIQLGEQVLHRGKREEYPDLAFLDLSDIHGAGLTVGIRFAGGWWPKSLHACRDGSVKVGLWPEENERGYWIRYGSHNTFEIMYDFHAEPTNPTERMKKFQYPLVAKAPVEWYNLNAQGIYPPYQFVSFADEKHYVDDRGWEYAVGWRRPQMKIWRYHYWGLGGFSNQHDFARIALVNFLRENIDLQKAGEYFLYSEARFSYNADWSIYHSDDYICSRCSKQNYGPQKNSHKANLLKVVFELEHPHWYGLPLYYYLTGDERIKDGILDWSEIIREWSEKGWLTYYARFFGWEIYSLAALYDFTGDATYMKMADRVFARLLKADNKTPWRSIFIDWERGYIAGGSEFIQGKDPVMRAGLMTGYIVFDGIYNYYLQMDEKNPRKERVADVLEGVSEFMYQEPYVEGKKKGHWAFWLPYLYNLADKKKSDHKYRLVLQAFYVNLAPYLSNGGDRWLERMDKIIRMAAWDQGGVWDHFTYMDHPGLQSMLYLRLHPREDTSPPDAIQDLAGEKRSDSVVLSWTSPPDAARYQIKYSRKKIVESLRFDPDSRSYEYDPSQYDNWWAGENVVGEPTPAKPHERQEFTVQHLKAGHYFFAIRSWDEANNRSRISNLAEVDISRWSNILQQAFGNRNNDH